ncbi:MAG: hypothetical protein GXP30_06405 [Verrucomicrobia bacterium]|nr:hypothetical protein [Verrucomicrobiota bacterium]
MNANVEKSFGWRGVCLVFFLSVLFVPLLWGEEVKFRGAKFTVYRIDPAKEKLELFWKNEKGEFYNTFEGIESSLNLLLRNGVGVDEKGRIVFACSDRSELGKFGRINLYGFAMLFKKLGCENALFLDGDISEIYVRGETGQLPKTSAFAAMFGITEKFEKD